MPYFDSFDICEAWTVLAHDWGLYNRASQLSRMGFSPKPNLNYGTLTKNGQEIYRIHDAKLHVST